MPRNCETTWTMPTPAAFPLPSVNAANPLYVNFRELSPSWGEFGQTFSDKFQQFNTIQSARVRRFEIVYDGLSEAQAAILDGHFDSTRGGLSFTLNHPRTAETLTGVRYEDYTNGGHQKKWSQQRTVRLVKPAYA